MKKAVAIIVMLCCLSSVYGQKEKETWASLDFFVSQNIMLGSWYDDDVLSDALYSNSSTDIGGRLNLHFRTHWAVWGELVFGRRMGKSDLAPAVNVFNEHDFNNYYIKNEDTDRSHRFTYKPSIGMSRHFAWNDKWNLVPSLGFGMDLLFMPAKSYTLKEKGSNNVYNVEYEWISSDGDEVQTFPLIFLTAEIKAERKFTKGADIFFSLNYRPYLTRMKFRSTVTDAYNYSEVSRKTIKGNFISTVGLSAGISF